MANPTTVAQWQQAKDSLVAQSNQLYAQYATLKQQGSQLAFQSADLFKQLKVTTDPVQRAQLQAQFDTVQSQLQQNNTKLDENQSQQEAIGNQIETANNEINRASSGTPNTNTTTEPANNNPGSNTQVAPLQEPPTPAVQYSVPPQLRIEVSPIGAGQFSYDVIDTERGKIIKSFDTQADADAYVAQQGATPGATSTLPTSYAPLATAPETTTSPDINNGAIGLGVDTSAVAIKPQETPNTVDVNNGAIGLGIDTSAVTVPLATPPEVTENVFNPGTTINAGEENVFNPAGSDADIAAKQAEQNAKAKGAQKEAQSKATKQDATSFQKAKDWRVRLSLAPGAKYLYNADDPGILAPLNAKSGTNGVIFPYTPNISVSYAANYDPTELTHSNYKVFQYKSSSVDNVSITGEFTAQDTNEANYLLAVIHFFRSVTKMFYGQDQNPNNGVPPPLVYLSGFGSYQFDNHPMAITGFTYTTPTDVDYIRAGSQTNMPGQNVGSQTPALNTQASGSSLSRLFSSNLTAKTPKFQTQNMSINSDATYVPTKVSITITAMPVVSRNDISNRFSLKEYATGKLLQGSKNNAGGIW